MSQAATEPIHVSDNDHFEELITDNEVALVDYYADWCGPCKMLAPTVEELAAETDAAVLKVDIDELQELAGEKGVRSVPTIEFYHNGEAADRVVGVQDKADLQAALDELRA
ncbi:thioredoxin [Halonotius pteroides]|jgi:thioredoxin 1|uniref:Thioredoxin n=1 Tax=Halonotius pteroides TaxID=268735 RepID=A0A3A6Q088_9EURY|nr:thioredoxin [Halonotius pteroides]RJX48524.1 thioredoxin [Halonotius pteroides]